jgi:dethiobiotin synthetase
MVAADKTKGLFVTGTDTGVGKTLVSAGLALFLRRRGLDIGVMKPVEAGVDNPDTLGNDGRLLQWAAASDDEPELITPYRLRAPLAPSVAAEKENVRIDCSLIAEAASTLASRHDYLIIEGAGGLMVPLAGGVLFADLIKNINFPLLTVCRPGLGTINHTLLTIYAARTMDIPLAGFLINNMPQNPGDAEESAPHTLASLASADLLGVLGHVSGSQQEQATALADQMEKLPTLPWLLAGLRL